MKIKPTENKLLVVPYRNNQKTRSGLYVAEIGSDNSSVARGVVEDVGPWEATGANSNQLERNVKPGDHVLYQRHGGSEWTPDLTVPAQKVVILPWQYVLAVLPKESLETEVSEK